MSIAADLEREQAQREGQLVLRDVSKVYGPGGLLALEKVSLTVQNGEFVCLVGASGCGKSTLLNLVAKLDRPSGGEIQTNGQRPALMFQEPALFPWLTVERNVDLALRLRSVPKAERREKVADLLGKVHLSEFAKKRPHELSGGMRQRVAVARALAQESTTLLMDEPFASLDAMTRDVLHDEIEQLWSTGGLTVLFVTHNVREAVRLGDRVIVMTSRPGRVAEEFQVELPRPRRIESADVAALASTITDRLRREVRAHGTA